LLPVSVDGTVAAASLSMLWAARAGLPTPWLARAMLGLGVLATLGANVGYGARYGLTGELLSGWPAVAFVGSVELALTMVRRTRTVPAAAHQPGAAVATSALEAARMAFAASVGVSSPLSGRALERQFGITRPQAAKVRAEVRASGNGHGEGGSAS
jgi:hypothetical protein